MSSPRFAGPISEINYWRNRNATMSALYEQLRTPNVRRVLGVLDESGSDVLTAFKEQVFECVKIPECCHLSPVAHFLFLFFSTHCSPTRWPS